MIRVYIIDDEDLVREGLVEYVDWYHYGMEVVGTAENGQEAYDYLVCHDVEIVISDIFMPLMDGLELVEKLKEISKQPLFILISGYGNFEYAQRAIKTNMVFEYILKPVNFEELDKVIAAAREKILQDKAIDDFPILSDEEWSRMTASEKNCKIVLQSTIINEIKMQRCQEAQGIFVETWKHMVEENFTKGMVSRYCIELLMAIIELVLEERNSREVLLEDPIREIRSSESSEAIRNYVLKMIGISCQVMSRKDKKDLSPVVQYALDYINRNYHKNNQSLNNMAETLNVSPNYLCLKFKEETGINYTKYLNSLRIKHAKELLKDARIKVYMVSDKVGFEDTRYFSRIFRTHTGYTPTEFQKKVLFKR